ncbi:MAG: hypothetical protein OQK52_00030 [Ignavibacteriaceae bacterium]|nr:hypothetical protein [Ignavibacteriaceae bacterium]
MKKKSFLTAVIFKLTAFVSLLILFSACDKSSDGPTDPNGGNNNQPVVKEYVTATRGWHSINGTNGITSTGDAISPNPGSGGWMTGYANINVGVFSHPVVTTYVENDRIGDPGNYRVETTFYWKGSIAGNGLAGAGAHVEITMEVRDFSNNIITTLDIHDKEVKESFLQIGGIIDQGSKNIAVDFNLPAGKTGFKVRFKMKVEAWSGLLGAITQCHFWDRPNLGRGAGWTLLKITELKN